MRKVINLKPNDDITTVVEYLWETGAEELFLVAPPGSSLLRNIIALKLLKREAGRLGKEVILVTRDELGREMAKRVDLPVKAVLPSEITAQPPVQLEEEVTLKEVPAKKFESLIEEEIKFKRQGSGRLSRKISDISFRPSPAPAESAAGGFLEKISVQQEIESKEKEMTVSGQELLKEEPLEVIWPSGETLGAAESVPVKEEKAQAPAQKEKRERKINLQVFSTKWVVVFLGGAMLTAAAALFFILPQAEIAISPKTESLEASSSVIADKGAAKIDVSSGRLPAQLLRLEKKETQEFPATGQRNLEEKAKGTITIYNEYSSGPQTLVATTRFVSPEGKVFRLVKNTVVPGAKVQDSKTIASSIEAEVTADKPGSEYNIGPSRFTIPGFQGSPKYQGFYGRSQKAMSGGARGAVKVVSADDLAKARESVWKKLEPKLDEEMRNQLPSGLKLLEGALKKEMGIVVATPGASEPADKFSLTLKGTASALIFSEQDLAKFLAETSGADFKDKKIEISGTITYQDIKADLEKGQLSFGAQAKQKIISRIDLPSLKKEVAGLSEAKIKEVLNRHSEIEKARVLFWPFWVNKVPVNLDKIKIRMEE